MSATKHHKKKHHKGTKHQNENNNEQSKDHLFSEADAKSVEVSGYTVGHGAPQNNQRMYEGGIPTGVVEIDKSVKFPTPSSKSRHHDHDSKPYKILRPSNNYNQENGHLPPISHHPQHNYPHGYYYSPADYYHGHLSYPYPVYYEPHSSEHHHHNHHNHSHHSHRHHHPHHHHEHEKEVETYDPRWWYMPSNTVHAPKLWQPPEYHYVQPKWYETSSRLSRMSINTHEPKSLPRKYVDCRCEVCRPSKETPRGVRWIVNE